MIALILFTPFDKPDLPPLIRSEMAQDELHHIHYESLGLAVWTMVCSWVGAAFAAAAEMGTAGQLLVTIGGGLMGLITLLVKELLLDKNRRRDRAQLDEAMKRDMEHSAIIKTQGLQIDALTRELERLRDQVEARKKR